MILGIDPSLRSSGWALVDDNGYIIDAGKFQTKKDYNTKLYSTKSDLLKIYEFFKDVLVKYRPYITEVHMEGGYIGLNRLHSIDLAEVRGVIKVLLCQELDVNNVKIVEFQPKQAKTNWCGNANATKEEMYARLLEVAHKDDDVFNEIFKDGLISRSVKNKNDDICDAICFAMMKDIPKKATKKKKKKEVKKTKDEIDLINKYSK